MTRMPGGRGILGGPTLSYCTKVNMAHQLIKVNTGIGSDYLLIEPTTYNSTIRIVLLHHLHILHLKNFIFK
jgi:hypothetical protein